MLQLPDPTASPLAGKILWFLGGSGAAAGIATLLKVILNWRKPKADIAKTNAETGSVQTDANVKLSGHLVTLHDRMNLMEAGIDQRQREYADAFDFYREQIEVFERKALYTDKLDLAYRNRSHALNGELGRLVLAITNLQVEFLEKTGEKAEAVEIHTYDQIIAPFPLPDAPA